MTLLSLLRKVHLAPPEIGSHVDDQTYSEAVMEDAVRESDRNMDRLAEVAASGDRTNAKMTAAIERLKISSVDKVDVIAELVRGMKSGSGRRS